MIDLVEELTPLADARWIGSSHPFDLHEAYLRFRSPVVRLDHELPAVAALLISADSRYRLWINGRFVARGPERCYPHGQSVDRLDVRPFLQCGENRLAVLVYQPGYSHFAYVHRGAAGFIAALTCDDNTLCCSDEAWRVCRDRSWSDRVPRVSIYGSGVEARDLRLMEGWLAPTFDDADWDAARTVALPGVAPWTSLRLREMPLLHERAHELRLIAARRGPTVQDADPHLALGTGWAAAEQAPTAVAVDGWLHPRLSGHESAYWLFDLGRSFVGQAWAEIERAGGGETLRISYAEKMRNGELVISDPATYCRVRMTDVFRLRSGDQIAESFSLRGGRFVLIELAGPTGAALRMRVHARVSEYPLAVTKPLPQVELFPESSPADRSVFARIAAMCEATLAACLQDSFIDCAWRENSQWLGDALPQALILSAMSDDVRPLRKVITMAAEGAYPDGVLPSILPGEVHAYTVLDYNFTWVELLTLYQKLTGDFALITQLWPTLVRMLARFQKDIDETRLLHSQPGRRLFLDWAPIARSEPSALYNLRYLHALQLATRLAQSLGDRNGDALQWSAWAETLQQAVLDAFWHDDRWYDDLAQTTFSQHSAAFALLTESTPLSAVDAQLEALTARSLDPSDEAQPEGMVLASPFMHHYVFEALRRHGRDQAVLAIIRLRWGRWAEAGRPTTWENWNVDFPDGSQSHAFSAHPRHHLAAMSPT